MRRFWFLGVGLLLGAGGGTFAMVRASHSEGSMAGLLYASGMVAIAVGVLLVLAGFQKEEGPPFDPGARMTEHEWSNDEQPWTLGESLGMAFWTVKRSGGKLALYALPVPLLLVVGGVAGRGLAPAVSIVLRAMAAALPRLAPEIIRPDLLRQELGILLGLLFRGLGIVLVTGPLIKVVLATFRSEKVTLDDGFRSLKYVPRLFLFAIIWVFAFVLTSPFLSFAAVLLLLTPFFIVDQDLPLFTAMRKSWRASSGHFGKLWMLNIAFVPLRLVGELTIIGTVFTVPLVLGALAYAYARVTGRIGMPYFPPEAGSRFIRSFLRNSLLALTAVFAGLIYWVESLSQLRGSAWNLRDAMIRASAILTGVFVIILMLALILPYMLDQLEGRRFTAFVAARHVRSQKSGFLTVISVLSICGVAISSCALSSVVSVMGGFSQDLKRKILGNNAHIVVDTTPGTPFSDYGAALERIRKIPGVVGATPVVHGEVMASSASNLAGVVVTGIDPESIHSVIDLKSNIEVGRVNYLERPELLTRLPANEVIGLGPGGERYYKGAELPGMPDDIDPSVREVILPAKADRPGVILGRELAKTLHVYIGDEVTLVSPLGDLGPMGVMPRTKKFRVAAIFYSGMYEYDATYVYTMMDIAQDYFQTAEKISAIEVKVEDAERADRITPLVVAAVGREDLRVRDWREINKNLFSALKLERFATFIILSVAIMVASFCIVCTLLLMVTEKGKEIAILKAIGASDGMILRTFIIEGIIIGGIGTVFGVVTGLAVCTGLSWFGLRLDPEVYYIDKLPISVNPGDFLTVAIAALTICTLSTLYPAYAASRLRPVDGLRDA